VSASAKSPLLLIALPCLVAIGFGCFAVAVDLHNDEVQAAVLALLVGGFVMGTIWPEGAWRWALILGLSIVAGDYAAPQLGLVGVPPQPINWGTLIAVIPAFIGTYVGVGVRKLLAEAVTTL
jgi:hypothetical protein